MIGTSVFKGIGTGQALNYEIIEIDIPNDMILTTEIDDTIDKYEAIVLERANELQSQSEMVEKTVGIEESQILLAHKEILNDPELKSRIIQNIKKCQNLVKSIDEAMNFFVDLFMQIEDAYIRERAKDIEDVLSGLIKRSLGITNNPLMNMSKDTIIFAKDLNPSDTVLLNEYVRGIVLSDGSLTSHTAIVAKAKGIPTLVGYQNGKPDEDDYVILDTVDTCIWINPPSNVIADYEAKIKSEFKHKQQLRKLKDLKAMTKDGFEFKLYGNIGNVEDTKNVLEQGGFGVGLLRTELVYMNSKDWPTIDQQEKIYSSICETMKSEVIIRTLDIGGDKMLPYYQFENEENPFLGLRAIRFCLKNQDIFKTQLKAILKASLNHHIKIMFPMIGSLSELLEAKKALSESMEELDQLNIPYDKDIQVGIMIEIPSAVFAIDILADHVDFVSIGTNDLCQYSLAVDRLNSDVSYLYDSMNISILRMIQHVTKECKKKDVEVGVCGEMASDLEASKILIGLGVDELSVSPIMIPYIKELMMKHTLVELQEFAAKYV